VTDEKGALWMSFGSWQRSGIQIVKLDPNSGKAVGAPTTLAAGQPSGPEAPHIEWKNGYYYLFENEDVCCRGMNSLYRIMVGRSKSITGPYLDKQGRDLAAGHYAIVSKSSGRALGVRGGAGSDSTLVDQSTPENAPAPVWNISPTGDGFYSISSLATGKYLDLLECKTADGTPISQYVVQQRLPEVAHRRGRARHLPHRGQGRERPQAPQGVEHA
jgi:hypothetical protein